MLEQTAAMPMPGVHFNGSEVKGFKTVIRKLLKYISADTRNGKKITNCVVS